MAEPVIFGGSPLDQYLQDAETEPSHTSTGNQPPGQAQKDSLSLTPAPDPQIAPETAHIPTPSRSPAHVPSTAAPEIVQTFADLDTARLAPPVDRNAASATKEAVRASRYGDVSSHLTNILGAFVERILLPLVLMTAQQLSRVGQQDNPSPTNKSHRRRDDERSNASSDEQAATFAEKFKYSICSSFLLTPSLSISFYESSPPFETQATNADVSNGRARDQVAGRRASAGAIHRRCYAEPADAAVTPVVFGASPDLSAGERLPRLDAHGRTARNAALLSSLFLLPPVSKSLRLWVATTIFIACLIWGYVLLFDHSSLDEKLSFTISREAAPDACDCATSLRNLSTTDQLSDTERTALQLSVLADVSRLIRAAQHFDVSINKAISAIQEVEIVSRGYKLTHPLPPISRIEAASTQPSSSVNIASPSRQRRSMNFAPTPGKLARSLSGGGAGAPTTKRHTQRPLSLNLSNGRASPFDRASGRATSGDMGEFDLTQKLLAEQTTVATAASRPAPQRLVELRKSIVMALEDTGAACKTTIASLELLADPEEVALLHELYALDEVPSIENDEADVSNAWSTGDASASFAGSPELDHDRRHWTATTPRNFGSNIRSAELSSFWSETDTSPHIGSRHHKRLSLVSDAGSVLDRPSRATSSLSRRSSLVSESGHMSAYRSPRFNYVSEKSNAASGPNESAAAKRLSYISNSSVATGSIDTRSPKMRNPSITSSTFTPPSAQTFSAATSPKSRATKRSSILGPNSIFANLDASLADASRAEPVDALSLLSIRAKFECMHRARRRWLCHLLAVRTKMSGDVPLLDGSRLPADEYWLAARSAVNSLTSTFSAKDKAISDRVAKEMGTDLLEGLRSEMSTSPADKAARAASSQVLLTTPSATNSSSLIAGHPELEDRLHAMMLSLRSLQSKIRVCAEDIHVKAPAGLHGIQNGEANKDHYKASASNAEPKSADDATSIIQLEKTFESMRDDLLGLSAEWEASVKLLHKHKRRTPSPLPISDSDNDAVKSSATRDLESPLEADEDAAGSSHGKGDSIGEGRVQLVEGASEAELIPSSGKLVNEGGSDDDDDSDLAELLLRSTSPNSLPPPGLEQVFESIAGLADLSGLGIDGKKATRAERIEQARRQRQAAQGKQTSDKAAHRHSMDPSGIMLELSDVIQTRKAVREQRHRSALPPTVALGGFAPVEAHAEPSAPPALVLGSPLDLGSAEQEGVFGGAHSYVDSQDGPRRSLSSLDLARARALQTLEARSPSAASSLGSNSFDSGDESQSRMSDEFSFEPTALESVPEDEAGTGLVLSTESPSVNWDSTSRKTTPKASYASLSASGRNEATPVPDSPFDLGAQVAAYARRKAAAKAHAAAVQRSHSDQGVPSQREL